MELCDLWENNMLVIAEIESISRFTFICKKDLEVGSRLYSLLEQENMKIYVISDELYKKLFDLTAKQLNEYKTQFDYYNNETAVLDDLFNEFIFLYYINGEYKNFYFVSDEIYYGLLTIDESGVLVINKNLEYNKEHSKKYIETYKHLYNGDYDTEEAIEIINKLHPNNELIQHEKEKSYIIKQLV